MHSNPIQLQKRDNFYLFANSLYDSPQYPQQERASIGKIMNYTLNYLHNQKQRTEEKDEKTIRCLRELKIRLENKYSCNILKKTFLVFYSSLKNFFLGFGFIDSLTLVNRTLHQWAKDQEIALLKKTQEQDNRFPDNELYKFVAKCLGSDEKLTQLPKLNKDFDELEGITPHDLSAAITLGITSFDRPFAAFRYLIRKKDESHNEFAFVFVQKEQNSTNSLWTSRGGDITKLLSNQPTSYNLFGQEGILNPSDRKNDSNKVVDYLMRLIKGEPCGLFQMGDEKGERTTPSGQSIVELY